VAERRALVALAVAFVAAYVTALGATFQFDDFRVLVDEPAVHSWAAWLASMPGMRPLTKASYVLTWTVAPGQAWPSVAAGLVLHALSTLLVFALARRWAHDFGATREAGHATTIAFVTALLFALHPAQTEAVTYIAGRSVALSALAWLASLAAAERARAAGALAPRWRALSVAAFVAAMAARETAWTLPFAIVLVERARGTPWRAALRAAAPQVAALVLCALAVAALPAYRRLFAVSLATRGPLANLAAQVEGIAYLVTHPLATLRVDIDPDIRVPGALDAGWLATALVLVGVLALGLRLLPRVRWAGFAVLWFFLALAPTNGPLARLDVANDRQLYLALVGPAFVLAILATRHGGRVARVAIAAVALACGVATAVRNTDYRSEVALWSATARASPGKARVWNNLGYAYRQAGRDDLARAAFNEALRLDPDDHKARLNRRDLMP
jgi:tetratricopeptide (TPR) repeat protein